MRRYLIVAMLAAMFVACTTDKTTDLEVNVGVPDVVYASIGEAECRVQLNDKCQTVWTKDDLIFVFSKTETSLYKFNGKTGDREGSFTLSGSAEPLGDGYKFDGKWFAIYDYYNFTGYGGFSDGTIVLFSEIQSVQTYLKNSYGLHANIMFGTSDDGKNYEFRNLLGYLRLSITGVKNVSKITVVGNDKEVLSGEFYFPTSAYESHQWYDKKSTSITLDCGSGVALTTTPTNFYFAMPPITLAKGLTVTVTFTDGTTYTQTTSKRVVIERNTIQPMATFNTNIDAADYCEVTIYHTGEFIEVPTFDNAVSGEINWGDGTVSLFNKFTTYDFTDGKESHTIRAEVIGATAVELKSCEGVSKIDLSNF